MVWVIDRIVDGTAICECLETTKTVKIMKANLPKDAKEGHIIRREGEAYAIDHIATERRQANLTNRMNKLFKG
ncbi:MAG: DUF3006 domain-containing protein [Defluviitaleaceae bacterium]|nr:DUF3006 domain-containing protein [Defluviitaleaceae bacterium]